ncbi:MAG TPA: MG2 domain-containing protein [Ferruginibacter sp.]|nr:MG2 domain-containing protein [Ferruginibacter sp.]
MNSYPVLKKINWFFLFAIVCLAITLPSCKAKKKWLSVDPAYSKYIDAYTSGVISKTASIKVQLSDEATTTHAVGEVVDKSLFDFSPSVEGTATWIDARTIEFKPKKNLDADQLYEVSFKLGDITKVPSDFATFNFNVQTLKPAFKVTDFGLRSAGTKDKMTLLGQIETADIESSTIVEQLLTATQNNQSLKINWQHNESTKLHNFTVEGITRGATASQITLSWDGKPLNVAIADKKDFEVPAIGDFKVMNIVAMNDVQQYASVQFSDPLVVGQELTGLINITDQSDITYTINGSEVKIYTGDKLDGNFTVNVNAGIKDTWGATLSEGYTGSVFFENRMPSVKIQGRGNILPNSGNLMIPFEAINLKAVDISIIQIYENNIPQFLQTNDLGSDNDLRTVAKPIVEKTLRLDDDKTLDLHKKQHFSLDIDKFIKTQPGAIYRIVIGFRPEYSLYTCHSVDSSGATTNVDGEDDEEGDGGNSTNGLDDQDDFWNRYGNSYPYGYDWDHKDNPCYKSYYNKDRWAVRNIIASNIGLTAKRGANNSLQVAVSDIISTEPMADVDLEVLDYQQQVIGNAKSDNDGFASFDLKEKPFLLIAKKASEKGYLKLDDGSTLPLSRFDVGGAEVVNGIKGFIFGERGVWRPGDSLYINCIIEDKENKLPSDIPVEFNLFNPQGQLYKRIIQHNANEGFNVFKTATAQTSPTGNWQVKIKVGGATFEKTIKVETIMPNRLKIDLNFGDSLLERNSASTGTLSSKWLFGTPAKNLKAKIDVSLYATQTTFKGFDGYSFDNPTGTYSTQSKTMFDGTLDADGNATVKPDFAIDDNAPGMLSANMLVKVFEPGGAFSIDNVTLPYSPYNSYAGIKLPEGDKTWGFLLTNKTHTAQIVDVDSKGKLLSGTTPVEVQFYKIQWRWWWDNSGESLSNFTQDQYNKLIKTETVDLYDGKGTWDFKVAANEWGRYLVLVKDLQSGHTTGQVLYLDEEGWQSRDNTDDPTAASMLSFTSDKQKYNVGDDVTLTIPSSKGGRALISIESGSKIIKTFWAETTQGQTVVKFTADKNMSPNVYVNVSLLQPHAQTINDLPIRMYGVIPIFVEDKSTILNPVITMPASLKPEQQSSITVSEKDGKEMTYCIAIVDEGLLDLTKFKTPDPHSYFYAREALGVKSWDLYDFVIGAWGGDLDRILTIGGDQDAGPAKQKKANRFKPVVQYLGPFHLNEGENQTHNFTLPQYIGSVRAMVVAADHGSYGATEKTVAVKKPLMILATMPRVLGPTESIKLPVTVFAMENNVKDVTVTLQSNPFLEVIGSPTQTVSFTETGEQQVYFDVNVKQNIGIGKVKVTATSGTEKADCDIELDIRNPNPPVTSITQKLLAANEQWSTVVSPIGVAATSKAVLEISSVPPMNLEKRLDYLIEYPYGCIEQTTSAIFPQLVLNQLTDLDDYRKSLVDRNIKSGITRLQDFQCSDGGFSYWPGQPESDEWGTNYAGHFLLEAQARGYTINESLLQQWKLYQRNKANEWAPSTTNFYGGDLTQSYRLFLLALAKAPELGAMNRLKEFKYLSPEAKWRLAAAYKLVGQDNVALSLISGLPTTFSQRYSPGFTYGSDLRDQSMVLETLTLLGRRAQAAELVTTIATKLSQDDWYSTQTTAYALIAIAEYCGKNPSGAKIIVNENINGKTVAINSSSYFSQTPVDIRSGNATVVISNKGNNALYVRLISSGQPLAGSDLHVNNNPAILSMNVSYLSQDGKPIDVSSLTQGTDFIAKVTIKNPGKRGDYTQMALSQIFPSGWEILNTRMMDGEGAFQSSPSDYQDIRDDRIYTYFDIEENKTLTYYVQLNASYLGRYFLPGTFCEAMYDNSITAGVNGRWIEVVAQ